MKTFAKVSAVAALLAGSQLAAQPAAVFDFVEYRALGEQPTIPADSYRNPVLPGFQPDPSIVKVGKDSSAEEMVAKLEEVKR